MDRVTEVRIISMAKEARRLKITLPAPLEQAVDDFDRIESEVKAAPTAADERARIADKVARGGSITKEDRLALATADEVRKVLTRAREDALRLLAGAWREYADDVRASLDARLAEEWRPLAEVATRTAPGDTPESLLRAGRAEEATALLHADSALARVRALAKFRDSLTARAEDIDGRTYFARWEAEPSTSAPLTSTADALVEARAGNAPRARSSAEVARLVAEARAAHEAEQKAARDRYAGRMTML